MGVFSARISSLSDLESKRGRRTLADTVPVGTKRGTAALSKALDHRPLRIRVGVLVDVRKHLLESIITARVLSDQLCSHIVSKGLHSSQGPQQYDPPS